MVNTTAPSPSPEATRSLEAIKEAARKLAFPDHEQLGQANGVDGPAGASKEDSPAAPNGLVSPAGFSQTGELVGVQPEQVKADPSNPALPPREVSKTIPCKFYPQCRYGNQCVFAHIQPAEGSAELAKPLFPPPPASVGGFYYPASQHPPPYPFAPHPPQDGQAGMPADYANYMAMGPYSGAPPAPPGNGPVYYQPGYGRNPYAQPYPQVQQSGYWMPQNPSAEAARSNGHIHGGAAEGFTPSPEYPAQTAPQAFSPAQNGASPNNVQSPPLGASQGEKYSSPASDGAFNMTSGAPVFHPAAFPPSNGAVQTSLPQRPTQTEAVMSASGMQGMPVGPVAHRKRNSFSLNSSSNRRPPTAPTAVSFPNNAAGFPRLPRPADFDPSKSKKRYQVECLYFGQSACRNGDACEFAHTMPDGTDSKPLRQNIVGSDGRVGDPVTLEEFRIHKEQKDREWRARPKMRDNSYPPSAFEGRGRERLAHPNGNGSQAAEPRGPSGKSYHRNQNQQRVPTGNDFPALPATPRSESTQRASTASSPEPPADADERMASSIASLASVTDSAASSTPASSFASAAARGAHIPQSTVSSRKLASQMNKAGPNARSHPVAVEHVGPELLASPIMQSAPIAAA